MIFIQTEKFLVERNLPKKAILLIDNAPSHPPADELSVITDDGTISVIFLPPNVTPLIQPMDQGIIRLIKLHYRNRLLTKLIADKINDIVISLKKVGILDAVSLLSLSWQNLSEDNIKKCWKKVFTVKEDEDDIPLAELFGIRNAVGTVKDLLEHTFPNVSQRHIAIL